MLSIIVIAIVQTRAASAKQEAGSIARCLPFCNFAGTVETRWRDSKMISVRLRLLHAYRTISSGTRYRLLPLRYSVVVRPRRILGSHEQLEQSGQMSSNDGSSYRGDDIHTRIYLVLSRLACITACPGRLSHNDTGSGCKALVW
ncbi:hypothetical protein HBI24_138450 [Parastagonospora nodorum]|nr:hypothetical protein HBH52_019120 [Parastagonospora nodorum]KAH3998166.1 hypothetical protein HBI10_132000 [Parastagonospora nodorum]KAH4030002.1 hypothetical protein HBI13_035600 [Parastagonospora nodorum]KAH4057380.1 hypothetical protein HBH49_045570 [Parastagonospora nodorum]KAH4076420.1 hypothetical protein HBH50_005530 [Parastagonospora nodorum]